MLQPAFGQQLHADANAEEGLSALRARPHQAPRPCRRWRAGRAGNRQRRRRRASTMRSARETACGSEVTAIEAAIAAVAGGALESLGRRMQVAGAVIDDRDVQFFKSPDEKGPEGRSPRPATPAPAPALRRTRAAAEGDPWRGQRKRSLPASPSESPRARACRAKPDRVTDGLAPAGRLPARSRRRRSGKPGPTTAPSSRKATASAATKPTQASQNAERAPQFLAAPPRTASARKASREKPCLTKAARSRASPEPPSAGRKTA